MNLNHDYGLDQADVDHTYSIIIRDGESTREVIYREGDIRKHFPDEFYETANLITDFAEGVAHNK